MLFGIWILVVVLVCWSLFWAYNERYKSKLIDLLLDRNNIENLSNEWLINFITSLKSKKKKNIEKYFFSPKGGLVRSRIWEVWKNQEKNIKTEIKFAKIYLGSNIQTPIEDALPQTNLNILDQIMIIGTIEDEIAFWKAEKILHFRVESIKECYSIEDFKLIMDSFNLGLRVGESLEKN